MSSQVVAGVALVTVIFAFLSVQVPGAPMVELESNPIERCPLPSSPHRALTVNDLGPHSIGAVFSMGDSFTAGQAAQGWNWHSSFDDYTGLSYMTGADSVNVVSVFNMIKHFNKAVQGGSHGSHFVNFPGQPFVASDGFNVAQSSSLSYHLSYQAGHVIEMAKALPKDTWKLVSIMIGTNDLNLHCHLSWELPSFVLINFLVTVEEQVQSFVANIRGVLDILHRDLPRTLVAIIPMYNTTRLFDKIESIPYCRFVHQWVYPMSGFGKCIKTNAETRERQSVVAKRLREGIHGVVEEVQRREDPLFSATVLPFLEDYDVFMLPNELGSSSDCYHPSVIGHQQLAITIWNTLLMPMEERSTTWAELGRPLKCPTESDRFHLALPKTCASKQNCPS